MASRSSASSGRTSRDEVGREASEIGAENWMRGTVQSALSPFARKRGMSPLNREAGIEPCHLPDGLLRLLQPVQRPIQVRLDVLGQSGHVLVVRVVDPLLRVVVVHVLAVLVADGIQA